MVLIEVIRSKVFGGISVVYISSHLISHSFPIAAWVMVTAVELESLPLTLNPIFLRYARYCPVQHPISRADFFLKSDFSIYSLYCGISHPLSVAYASHHFWYCW
jgi:hypothetical protein